MLARHLVDCVNPRKIIIALAESQQGLPPGIVRREGVSLARVLPGLHQHGNLLEIILVGKLCEGIQEHACRVGCVSVWEGACLNNGCGHDFQGLWTGVDRH